MLPQRSNWFLRETHPNLAAARRVIPVAAGAASVTETRLSSSGAKIVDLSFDD
jgi:hypothetical protein